jgi:hypothetical protein
MIISPTSSRVKSKPRMNPASTRQQEEIGLFFDPEDVGDLSETSDFTSIHCVASEKIRLFTLTPVKPSNIFVRFEVLVSVIVRAVTTCDLVSGCQRFGRICHLCI